MAEVVSRFDKIGAFVRKLTKLGFSLQDKVHVLSVSVVESVNFSTLIPVLFCRIYYLIIRSYHCYCVAIFWLL